jgi:hypothetical protein
MSTVQIPSCGLMRVPGVKKTDIFIQAVMMFFFSNFR